MSNETEENVKEAKTYSCPSCGAALTFAGTPETLTCAYCQNEIQIAALLDSEKKDFPKTGPRSWEKYGADKPQWKEDNVHGYSCPMCGGEIVCEKNTAATSCPYCDCPTLLEKSLTDAFRPDLLVPFAVSREEAEAAYQAFFRGKYLLPTDFAKTSKVKEIKGIYVPFWLFDCEADGLAEYTATRETTWRQGDYRYVRTNFYKLFRRGKMGFADIPVDADKKLDNRYMEAVEPFRLSQAVPFDDAYLTGYFANRYDDTAEECAVRAGERVEKTMLDSLRRTCMGYDTVSEKRHDTFYPKNEVKYAMLPVWFVLTKYKDKEYPFIINGQTGRTAGKLPVSPLKFWGVLAGVSVVLGGLFSVLSCFLF